MDEQKALARERQRLKVHLWGHHKQWTGQFWEIICPWCGLPVRKPDDAVMHEWLIRRGRLPLDQQWKIMHEINCVLLHSWCSDEHETSVECKEKCARAQYQRYDRDTVVAWVMSLELKQHVEIPEESEVGISDDNDDQHQLRQEM